MPQLTTQSSRLSPGAGQRPRRPSCAPTDHRSSFSRLDAIADPPVAIQDLPILGCPMESDAMEVDAAP